MNIVDVIRSLAGFAWLGALGLGILAVARASRNQSAKGIGSTVVIVLIVALVLSPLGAGLVYVEANERGVVKTIRAGGVKNEPLSREIEWHLRVLRNQNHLAPDSICQPNFITHVGIGSAQISNDNA